MLYISTVPSDYTPPSTTDTLIALALSESQINLTWQAADDPESGISKYNVYRDSAKVGQSTTTSYSDIGLNENTTYTYEVSAVNGAGLEGLKSSQDQATTFADNTPPTIVSVSAASDSTHVTVVYSKPVEQASAEDISNYTIDNGIALSGASLGLDLKTVTLITSSHTIGVTYTLTVNNIKDRATIPNTIVANTETTYIYIDQFVITNLTVTTGNTYEVVQDGLQVGAPVYTDRGYTFTSIPSLIQGATYIQTANDDSGRSDNPFISFDVNQDVTIYIAHDDRETRKPLWMASFTDTSNNIVTSDTTFSLFSKDFSVGTVTLGGNEAGGNSMYTVVLKNSQGLIDSIQPMPPRNLRKVE